LKNRVTAGIMAAVMALTMWSCAAKEEEPMVIEPSVLHIYTDNGEFQTIADAVCEKHPEWKGRIVVEVIEGDYCTVMAEKVDKALNPPEPVKKKGDETEVTMESVYYPDLIVSDIESIDGFINADYVVSLEEMGISDADTQGMYPYTLKRTENVEAKPTGLSWLVKPGAFVYRRSVATEYLGSDDPKDVQSYMRDWSTFCDTARTLSKKSGGRVKMLAGIDDISRVFAGNTCFRESEEDKAAGADVIAEMEKNGFTAGTEYGTDQYYRKALMGDVFGYFADTDFILDELTANCGGTSKGMGSYGDWGVCEGPMPFITGGSWIFGTKECADRKFAAAFMKAVCCEGIAWDTHEDGRTVFVNDVKTMTNAYNAGKGKADILGGMDYIEVYSNVAEEISGEQGQ